MTGSNQTAPAPAAVSTGVKTLRPLLYGLVTLLISLAFLAEMARGICPVP